MFAIGRVKLTPVTTRAETERLVGTRARMILFLLLSSLPILEISADVFGLVSQRTSGMVLLLPLAAILAVVITFFPHATDSIIARGLVAGMVACLVYDGFRLFAVYVLGSMGDFIPTMGTWITGDANTGTGALVGYIWRYLGDGGGLGVAFYIVAFAAGLQHWSSRPRVVLAAVGYAVFPVWTGLIATVALARRGEQMMFRLTPSAITITLIGHLIFGFVLGLGFLAARRSCAEWPWTPLLPRAAHLLSSRAAWNLKKTPGVLAGAGTIATAAPARSSRATRPEIHCGPVAGASAQETTKATI
jgi:hypothetical protein